jgi:hypothetical protein
MKKSNQKKKARLRYDNVFKTAWTDEFHFIKHSRKGIKFAFCEFCRSKLRGKRLRKGLNNLDLYSFIRRRNLQKINI